MNQTPTDLDSQNESRIKGDGISRGAYGSSLSQAYEALGDPRLAQRAVSQRADIYPIFRELFSRNDKVKGKVA